MLHRIRLAMRRQSFEKLGGEVEAGEAFIGGKIQNMHKKARRRLQSNDGNNLGKTVVLGLLQREGEVRAAVAPSRRKKPIHDHIGTHVASRSTVYTDLDKQCFRFNKRRFTDAERFLIVLGQTIGRRITYKGLAGGVETLEVQSSKRCLMPSRAEGSAKSI